MKRKLLNGLLLALLLLSGCGNGSTSYSSATTESSTTTRLSELFSNRDLGPSYDEANSSMIALTGNSVSADSGNNRSGGTITLTDSKGNSLASYDTTKAYDSVIISCADISQGNTYTISNSSQTITMDSLAYGTNSGIGGGLGGDGGAMPNGQPP